MFCSSPSYFSPCRLDDIVKSKEDCEYSRITHYNKGLRLLNETLKSEKTQHKGKDGMFLYKYIHCNYSSANVISRSVQTMCLCKAAIKQCKQLKYELNSGQHNVFKVLKYAE